MWSVSIPKWGQALCGQPIVDGYASPYRPNPLDYEKWINLYQQSATVPVTLRGTEDHLNFFKMETDLALLIPRNAWAESFYSMKNGFTAPNCPAIFIYFAKTIFKKYNICNLIAPVMPKGVRSAIQRQGYFGAGFTGRDAICSFVHESFQPITEERMIVRCGDWYEAYIPNTGMVAALPLDLGKILTNEDLYRIEYMPGFGLMLKDTPLALLAGKQGRCLSYDLR